jgi:hypothetical protein
MWFGTGPGAKAQVLPRKKFAMEQVAIAMRFAASSGRWAVWIRRRMRMRFPSSEMRPLESWKRRNWWSGGVAVRRSRQV